jgi:hypothetical protein
MPTKTNIYNLEVPSHQDMVTLYKDGLDEKVINGLNVLNQKISDEYSKGKINNEQFTNLKEEISVLYEEIYKRRIDSLKEPPKGDVNPEAQLEDVTDAYSRNKINSEHYASLKNKISIKCQRIFKKRLDSLGESSKSAG